MSAWLSLLLTAGMSPIDGESCLDERLRQTLVTLRPRGSKLTAVIAPTMGGQLVGLTIDRGDGPRQLLYRGMNFCPTTGFDGKAPILWPATGRTYGVDPAANGGDAAFGWRWRGKRYPMPIHGFAKDSTWRVRSIDRAGSSESVTLELFDTPATRAHYPFRFAFTVTYRLRGDRLTMDHRITAGDNRAPMPFSIGNHITFALPLAGSGALADASVSTVPQTRLLLDRLGRPAGRQPQSALAGVRLATLGRETALPLAGYGRTAVAVLTQAGIGSIVIRHAGSMMPSGDPVRFNLWGNADAGFFAVEPWMGMQNALATGDGVIRLRSRATFAWNVSLAFALQPQ